MKLSQFGCILGMVSFFGLQVFAPADDVNTLPSKAVPNSTTVSSPTESLTLNVIANDKTSNEIGAGMHRPRRYQFATSAVASSTTAAVTITALNAMATLAAIEKGSPKLGGLADSTTSGAPSASNQGSTPLPALSTTAVSLSVPPAPEPIRLSSMADQAEHPLMDHYDAAATGDPRRSEKNHLVYRLVDYVMQAEPPQKASVQATTANNQTRFAMGRSDVGQQPIRRDQNSFQAENGNRVSPALPALSTKASLPSIILAAATSPASSTGAQPVHNAAFSEEPQNRKGLNGAPIDQTPAQDVRNDNGQQQKVNQDQNKSPAKMDANPQTIATPVPRVADTRISALNDRTGVGNQGQRVGLDQRKTQAESSNKLYSTTSLERVKKPLPAPASSGKFSLQLPNWFWPSMIVLFGYLWVTQFIQLNLMSEHDFPHPYDKQSWIFAFIVVFVFAPFAFLAWKYYAFRPDPSALADQGQDQISTDDGEQLIPVENASQPVET